MHTSLSASQTPSPPSSEKRHDWGRVREHTCSLASFFCVFKIENKPDESFQRVVNEREVVSACLNYTTRSRLLFPIFPAGGANPRFQVLPLSAVHGGAAAELQGRRSRRHERRRHRGGVTASQPAFLQHVLHVVHLVFTSISPLLGSNPGETMTRCLQKTSVHHFGCFHFCGLFIE